jgi:hypothetical protein
LAVSHSLRRSAWASRAMAAGVGCFPLLAVLVFVADEHPTFEATAGPLQASVVSLYGVVMVMGVTLVVSTVCILSVGRVPGSFHLPRGRFFISRL